MTLQMVPILRETGLTLATAAALAGVVGISSIAGRLCMGFLLDILPTRVLGVAVFLLPLLSAVLLAYFAASFPLALLAAAILGLSVGAESDVLNYIASHRFDHAIFGSISAIIQTVLAVASVGGMMIAGALADFWGSYQLFLMLCIPTAIAGAAALATIPDAPPLAAVGEGDIPRGG